MLNHMAAVRVAWCQEMSFIVNWVTENKYSAEEEFRWEWAYWRPWNMRNVWFVIEMLGHCTNALIYPETRLEQWFDGGENLKPGEEL